MDFSVGEHFEGFIRQQVNTGIYSSADEVICSGLRLLEAGEQYLRDQIQEGINCATTIPAEESFGRLIAKYSSAHDAL